MRLEAKDGSASAMLGPSGFAVRVTRRGDHRGVYKSSGLGDLCAVRRFL
jgi:hypothetical protein